MLSKVNKIAGTWELALSSINVVRIPELLLNYANKT
jgi:hypothetical protein